MRYLRIIWDDDANPVGNVQHIAEHGLTVDDVEHVLQTPTEVTTSRSTGRACCFGFTPDGDYIIVVYDLVDDDTIYPVTAYEVPEP
jgi:uncharacterized DUF497 family protein